MVMSKHQQNFYHHFKIKHVLTHHDIYTKYNMKQPALRQSTWFLFCLLKKQRKFLIFCEWIFVWVYLFCGRHFWDILLLLFTVNSETDYHFLISMVFFFLLLTLSLCFWYFIILQLTLYNNRYALVIQIQLINMI